MKTIDPNMAVGSTEDRGYLVGSIAAVTDGEEVAPFNISIAYREKGTNRRGRLEYPLGPFGMRDGDVSEHDYEAKMLSHEIPPGEYEICGIFLLQPKGQGYVTYSPKEEFSVPFSIRKNTATYFGQIMVRGIPGRFLYLFPDTFGARIFVSDESKRDIPLILAKDFIVREGRSAADEGLHSANVEPVARKGMPEGITVENIVYGAGTPFIVQKSYQYFPLVQ